MSIKTRVYNIDGSIAGWMIVIKGNLKYVESRINIDAAIKIFKDLEKLNDK